jgi:hypothetical protein
MALSVKLYRVVGKGKDRRYVPIDLGRREGRSKEAVCRRRMCPLSPGNVCSPPRAPLPLLRFSPHRAKTEEISPLYIAPSDTFVHRNVSSYPIVLDYVQYQALYAVQIEDTLCFCPGRRLGNAGTGSR